MPELVGSFADVGLPETTALLAALAVLAPDELGRARARQAFKGQPEIRSEWSKAALRTLTNRFFGLPFGRGLHNKDNRQLLGQFLWFGTDSGPGAGDPMRWSPVAVEILLEDWIPRKIVADAGSLAKAPRCCGNSSGSVTASSASLRR